MKEKKTNFHQKLNAKFNLAFVIRVNPEDLQRIKNFVESLENSVIVYSEISGDRLFIKKEGGNG